MQANSPIMTVLNNLLKNYFNKNIKHIDDILNNIFIENQWHNASGVSVSALAKEHFKSIGQNELTFIERLKKLSVFIQKYFVLSGLYTDGAFNILRSEGIDKIPSFSYGNFKKLLIKKDICFWEPGIYHCLCCLPNKRSSKDLETFTNQIYDNKILDQIFTVKDKKVHKIIFKNNNKTELLSTVLSKLHQFCLGGTVYIYKEYSELPKFLDSDSVDLKSYKSSHELFLNFLGQMMHNIYASMIKEMKDYNLLKHIDLACINNQDDYYEYAKNLKTVISKKPKDKLLHHFKHRIEKPSKVMTSEINTKDNNKNSTITINKDLNNKADLTENSVLNEATEIKLMSLDLNIKTTQLKKQFQTIEKTLELHKVATKGWIKKIEKIIQNIQCSFHESTECEVCLNSLPQGKLNRFKYSLEEKSSKIQELKKHFEECYLCINNILHEEHVHSSSNLEIMDNGESLTLLENIKFVEGRVELSKKSLDDFISCCGKINNLYEETVPHCCSFHLSWARILEAAKKIQQKSVSTNIKSPTITTIVKDDSKENIENLYKEAGKLENEFREILDFISSQSQSMELIFQKIPTISTNYSCAETLKNIEQSVKQTHNTITDHSHHECERLRQYLHNDVSFITQDFISDIDEARNKLENVKKNYSLFLTSCNSLQKMYKEITYDSALDEEYLDIPNGLTLQKIPGDGHCLFNAVGLYTGHSVQDLRKKVAKCMRENADEFVNYHNQDLHNFYDRIEKIENSNEWGDAIEIEALQRTLERPIVIVRPNNLITLFDNIKHYEKTPIFLYYNGVHYDSLIITGSQSGKEILNNIVSSSIENTSPTEKTSTDESCCEFHDLIQAQQNLKSTDALSNQQVVISKEDFFEQLSTYLPAFLIEELNFSNDILGDQP